MKSLFRLDPRRQPRPLRWQFDLTCRFLLGDSSSRKGIRRRRRHLRAISLEQFEERSLLAAVVYGPQQVVDGLDADGPSMSQPADIDGDGDMDVVVASYRDNGVSWYENDGQGNFTSHPIARDAGDARAVVAADFDGDLDLDIAVAAYGSDSIQWYENLDGAGTFDDAQLISSTTNGVLSLAAADLDANGTIDLVSASWFDDKVAWYANDGQGAFGAQQIISTATDGPRSLQVGDVDGDDRPDIVVASRLDDSISWFGNLGNGQFGARRTLAYDGNGPQSIALGDADNDGDLDLFLATYFDEEFSWFENTNGNGTFGPEQTIATASERAQSIAVADLDGDGDMDVLTASSYELGNSLAWHENSDGLGSFGSATLIASDAVGIRYVTTADIDEDGAADVLAASIIDNKVSWFRNNLENEGGFSQAQQITSDAGGAASVDLADFDGDGDLDLVAAAYWDNEIAWYENIDGLGTFAPQQVISTNARRAQTVRVADVDGDDDMDILSASYADGKIAWYENTDGLGTFSDERIITNRLNGAIFVHAADVDHDGDLDVVSASAGTNNIVAWYENLNGQGEFGDIQILTRRAIAAEWISTADLDGDGDLDIISAAYGDGDASTTSDERILWFENEDGQGSFSTAKTINTGGAPSTAEPVDVDGDGDLDIVSTRYGSRQLVWIENLGDAVFAEEATVIAENLRRVEALSINDVDGNGTPDLLVGGDLFIAWYERLKNGSWVSHFVTSDVQGTFDVVMGDLNGDQQLDIASASFYDSKIAVYFNESTVGDFDRDGIADGADLQLLCAAIQGGDNPADFDLTGDSQVNVSDMNVMVKEILQTNYGDADLDGVFNSRDLVLIFQAGEYEDDIENNSTWAEGDWNCDGDFTTQDLVLAFQSGAYVSAAHSADDLLRGKSR